MNQNQEHTHAVLYDALSDPLALALIVHLAPRDLAEKALRLALALARAQGRAEEQERARRRGSQ